MNRDFTKPRLFTLAAIALIVPLGFALKLIRFGPPPRGPIVTYLNNSLAGSAYEVFWCLAIFLLFPTRRAITPICVAVFLATTALEFLQLWQPAPPHPLATARSTFLGRTLLGHSFSWTDIPHYALGCALAWLLLRAIARPTPAPRPPRTPAQ